MSRRGILRAGGAAAMVRGVRGMADVGGGGLDGARGRFAAVKNGICLNNARWHPLSDGAGAAMERYIAYKRRGIWAPPDEVSEAQRTVKEQFARLIGASAGEIAYVTSTTAGENLIVNGMMDRLRGGGNIVTDGLHFEGSLYQYESLARQGIEVRIVRPREWGIDRADLTRAVDGKTRLVAVSQVSYVNGFSHAVKEVCALAHAHGAYCYVDLVQAAGAVPVDVRAAGVDFAACASYKWLMGDMGLGFLYVREGLMDSVVKRTVWGWKQFEDSAYHEFPGDAAGPEVFSWVPRRDAAGMFEVGTYSNMTVMALSDSLAYLNGVGAGRVAAYTAGLRGRIRKELAGREGFECVTPVGSVGPIITFRVGDVAKAKRSLAAGKVDVSWTADRMRISPSVYNDAGDVGALLAALV